MRSNYWTCSKFADWLRGTPKPQAASSEGWDEWNKSAKAAHPFRFWLADDGLDALQKTIFFPADKLYDIKYYINNRWVTRTNSLTAHARDIKPGEWQDVGHRLLPCIFNGLVDYVEIELAWFHVVWDDAARKKFDSPWYATGWFRWRTWRSRAAGLANLEWQCNLTMKEDMGVNPDHPEYGKPTSQSISAKEIMDLYYWWTETHRNRPDAYKASGWSDYCEKSRIANDGKLNFSEKSDDLKKMCTETLDALHKIEKQYEDEDEEMLIRLIKIRSSLWT